MRKLLTILLAVCFAYQAYAQEKRVALVIGNAQYSIAQLKNPVNDAFLMEQTLKDLGFEVYKTTNATKAQMLTAIDDFKMKLATNNVALFYYAGHGMEIGGKNYLIPIDAKNVDENSIRISSIDVGSIVEEFENYSKNVNIVILDACRDNPFLSATRGNPRGFKVIPAPAGTIIAFATAPGAVAQDGDGQNGLYSSKLAVEMLKPQRIEDVFINTRNAVLAVNRTQNPQEWSQLRNQFYFKQPTKEEPIFNPGISETAEGSISIDSEIAGTLYLNGKGLGNLQAGTKGAKLEKVAAGSHTIKIVGTETFETTVTVSKNQTAYVTAKSKAIIDLPNQIIDPRDNKTYKIVQIGSQTWFAENLAYAGNNSFQKQITYSSIWNNRLYNGWCYYDNDATNAQKHGILYQWEAAKNACPQGWHLPSDDEWKTLEKALGMSQIDADKTGWRGTVGISLKVTSGWNNSGNGTNDSKFSALPSGYRSNIGRYYELDNYSYWWSSSAKGATSVWFRYLYYDRNGVNRSSYDGSYGFSVRCIRD